MKLSIPHKNYVICFAVLLTGILLQGCTAHPGPVTIQKVDMPVAVSCQAKAIPEPVWSIDALPGTATYGQRVQAAFEDLASAKAYAGELVAELSACK